MQGIPLYQLLEMHRHVVQLQANLPAIDLLCRSEPGSGTVEFWRKTFAALRDDQVILVARALAGLVSCDRVVGMTEIPVKIEGDVTVLKPFVTLKGAADEAHEASPGPG